MIAAAAVGCGDEAPADNSPPEFVDLDSEQTVEVGETLRVAIAAEDPDGDAVTLASPRKPEGAEFAPSDGFGWFSWSPLITDAEEESHEAVFVATDSNGARSTWRMVIHVENVAGQPRFVSSSQRVLDLSRSEALNAEVVVKDDDSLEVEITIEDQPDGMSLTQTGDKNALIEWKPTPKQIEQKRVWGASIIADDGSGGRAMQDFTVTLLTKDSRDDDGDGSGQCGTMRPTITHQELGDQRAAGDVEVSASITDQETFISSAVLFWTTQDPSDFDNYEAVPMENVSGDQYSGLIPNPLSSQDDEPQEVFYLICALDDDDPEGDECDNLICAPDRNAYRFTAYPEGDTSCRADSREPNDTTDQATDLPLDEWLIDLSLCEGDTDLYAVDMAAGESLVALIAFTEANGDVHMRMLGPGGEDVIVEGGDEPDGEYFESAPVEERGTYYLEISGEPNSYELTSSLIPASEDCTDPQEPNDSADQAPTLSEGAHPGLQICADDQDYFGFELEEEQTLTVDIQFPHASGDLDMRLFAPGMERPVATSLSTSDDEHIEHTAEVSGLYILVVAGYDNAVNAYDMEVAISGGGGDQECSPDDDEPNDTPLEASFMGADEERGGLSICADDRDYFGVTLDAGERIRAALEIADADADLDLGLLAPDAETEVASSEGIEATEIIRYTAMEGGEHYLHVFGFSGDSSDYSLTTESCANDPGEPNDTAEAATSIEAGSRENLELCFQETDWYAIDLTEGELILAEVASTADLADLELTLYTSQGEEELASGRSSGDQLSFLREVTRSGTYLIRVRSLRDYPDGVLYDLNIEVD